MKSKKRALLCCFIFMLVLSLNCLSGIATGEQIKDIDGHWAKEGIQKAIDGGYASGYNQCFRPNNPITRAEFITLINKYFGYSNEGNIKFKDVSKNRWYYKQIGIATLAGYVQGDSEKIFRPEDYIKREEAAVMISQIIKADTEEKNEANKFKDHEEIAAWGKSAMNVMVKKQYISGYKDKTLRPKENITRAEAITLINNVVKRIYDQKGVYGKKDKKEIIDTNVLVNTPNVTLQNLEIRGDLYLSAGIGNGDVTLEGIKVNGKTVVEGGGENSVILKNTMLKDVLVNKMDGKVRLLAKENTEIQNIKLASGAKLQENLSNKGEGFKNVDIEIKRNNQTVQIDATVDAVNVEEKTNNNTFIKMTSNAGIKKIVLNKKVKISETGKIEKAVIKAEGVKIKQAIKEIDIDKKISFAEINGKKVKESRKEEVKKPSSGGGGGSSHSSSNTHNTDKPNKPEDKDKESNIQISNIKIDSSNLNCFLLKTKEEQSVEKIIEKAFENVNKEKMFLVYPFEDKTKVLMTYFGDDLKSNISIKECSKDELQDLNKGLYSANEGNILEKETKDEGKEKKKIRLIVGDHDTENKIIAGEYLFAIPEFGSITTGIELSTESKYVGGITLNLEKTTIQNTKSIAGIASGKDRFGNMIIENNILDFGKNSEYVVRGIYTMSPVNGKLSIKNNVIKGFNLGGKNQYPLNGAGAIQVIERLKENADVSIENNIIKDTAYHGICVCPGETGKISIVNNQFDNIGQNAICISKFKGANNIDICGNKITAYGTRKIKKKTSWNDPTLIEVNLFENAIALDYIDKNYGLQLNNKWFNTKENIINELKNTNTIATKEENDSLKGVMDSTEIYINREYNFENPAEYINKYESRVPIKNSLVIVKDKDGDVVYGRDPEHSSEKITVKSLIISGEGQGRVELAKGLVVEGDLIIDLPHANLLNNAEVKGKLIIKNIKSLDASNAIFTVVSGDSFTLGSAPDTGMIVSIKDVVNKEKQSIAKEKTNLNKNIKIYNGRICLKNVDYEIDDSLDEITLKKEYLDTLKENGKIRIEYTDFKNKISKIQSRILQISISDNSAASIQLVFGNEFVVTEAPREGAKITITNIKDKNGNIVPSKRSKLQGNIKIKKYNKIIEEENYIIDDETDMITIKKEFLDTLDRTHSSFMQLPTMGEYDVYYEDVENHVTEIEAGITFKILNRSFATIKITSLDTFTVGKAPDEGITISITDIKDYKGQSVAAKDSHLVGAIKVIPFPIDWNRVSAKGGLKEEFYSIDDDLDTITLKKSYLDLLEIDGEKDVEKGSKIFRVEYRDPVHKTEISSSKMPVTIKKVQAPRSKSTLITSKENAYEIVEQDGQFIIKAKDQVISTNIAIKDFLKHIKRDNERQRLRVYGLEDVQDHKIPSENMNHYKAEYLTLYEGDALLVTAEDGVTHKLYKIEVKSTENVINNSIEIEDNNIVKEIKNNIISVRDGQVTIKALKDALEIKNEATIVIKNDNDDIIENEDTRVTATMKVVVTINDASAAYKIKVGGEPVYRALLVGNSDYPGDKMDLVGPHNDINKLEKTLKVSIFGEDTKINPIKKTENRLKKDVFRDIQNTFRDAKDNDVSYFYYSGHGARKENVSYLCTVSAEESDWISVSELERELSKIPGKKVVILDCCNSGGFIDKEFVSAGINEPKYFNDAVIKTFKQSKRGFLNGNEFKVLTASAANEYSFESKAEAIGRFTKALCDGCGYENKFLADENKNGLITLMEAYEYLEKNVSATSHVQVYPYNDNFVILGNATGVVVEIKNSIVISATDKYKIINNKTQKAILSQEEKITDQVKVKDFLKNIIKDHQEQVLEVYPSGTIINDLQNKKELEDCLAKGDKLLVRAEDGTAAFYQIFVNKYVNKETSTTIKASIDYMINKNGNIASMMTAIDTNKTVSEFLVKIIKDDKNQKLYVFSQDSDISNISEAKNNTDHLAVGDQLLVIAADGEHKKIYHIIVKEKMVDPTNTNINVENHYMINQAFRSINSRDTKIDTNMTVGEFLSHIKKEDEAQKLYVVGLGKDISNKKADSDHLEEWDRLIVIAADGVTTAKYSITVEKAKPVVEKDDTLDIRSSAYRVVTNPVVGYQIGWSVFSGVKLDTNTSVGEFLGNITKGHEKQKLYVFSKDADMNEYGNAKGTEEKMQNEDQLLVVAEDESTRSYKITLAKKEPGIVITPPAEEEDKLPVPGVVVTEPEKEKPEVPSIEVTESEDKKPEVPSIEVTESEDKKPEAPSIEVTEPEDKKPEVPSIEVTEPEDKKPEAPSIEVTEPEDKKPEVPSIEVTESEDKKPEIPSIEVTESEDKKPEVPSIEVTEPEK
ncbi:S-layer homology domain-containing protein [Crassaminicella profunda]|uniref:S-layer homology domain-containing protein n=1 Tax=Crassaminicella profunda TaxID=1286698 RepID=UPI001CA6C321|nr:S-layer homology domain-containing protein [Crassaminicella profunda]QZY55658.1 S-layer homology domain-containing protein [Crassaminicella profunda]